jgi:hypothetical protein
VEKHPRIDVLRRERLLQGLARHAGFGIEHHRRHPGAIDRAGRFRIEVHAGQPPQLLPIGLENLALARNQRIDALDLCAADRGLQIRHLVFVADHVRPELLGLAAGPPVVGQRQHTLVQRRVLRHEHATLAGGQRLGAVEGETAEHTHAAGTPPPVL